MARGRSRNRKFLIQVTFGAALIAVLAIAAYVAWVPLLFSNTHTSSNLAYHVHAHIAIMVNHVNITIPGNIGHPGGLWFNHTLDRLGVGGYAPLLTRTESGVIHVEANTAFPFFLEDFFNIWGERLTDTPNRCVMNYCQSPNTSILILVNGDPPDPSIIWTNIPLSANRDVFFKITTSITA